jgi:hypothetical protein
MPRWLALFVFSFLCCGVVRGEVKVEKVEYHGWQNCYRVSNGDVELVVTADAGPRIIRFGFVGGQNFFKEIPEQLGGRNEEKFQLRGGARVWKAPEDPVATWAPDNAAVSVTVTPNGLVATAPVEPSTRLQKEIEVRMASHGAEVDVFYRITNRALFSVEYSAWGITMMAPGGVAFSGFPPRGEHPAHLEPTNPLVMWAYTNLSDKRWAFTKKYLSLRQDPNTKEPQKLGMFNADTWAAYILNGEAFIKHATAYPGKTYPDFGCSLEVFTNNEFLELETLSPLTNVPPGKTVEQTEHWSLHRGVHVTDLTDELLDAVILPLLPNSANANPASAK